MLTPSRAAWIDAWEGDLTPSLAAQRSAERLRARTRAAHHHRHQGTAPVSRPANQIRRDGAPPELRVVTRRGRRRGVLLLALMFAGLVLAVSVVVPVLVNSTVTGVESAVGGLEVQREELAATVSALSAQVSALSSPERVTEEAAQLGLGPARSVHYVQAGTGTTASEGGTTVAGR